MKHGIRGLLLCVGITMAGAAAGQDIPPAQYSIKEDAPTTGSRIRRDAITGSDVDLDKPFAALSPAEQAIWKSQYENLGPNDVPPFPAKGLGALYKAVHYASIYKEPGVGSVSMFVQVDETGRATQVSVLQGSDRAFIDVVVKILMLTEYTPARCNGEPCVMEFPYRMNFVR